MRDWAIGLSCAVVTLVSGIVYIGLDFYEQYKSVNQDVAVEEQEVLYNDKEVIHYAELYKKREMTFDTLRQERSAVIFQEENVEDTTENVPETSNSPTADNEVEPLAEVELAQ